MVCPQALLRTHITSLFFAKLYDAAIQFIADRWIPGSGPTLSVADWMFIAHHAVTALYMTSARLIRAGHMSAMALMFLGELTAPIMNVLRISNTAASIDSSVGWLQAAHPYFEYAFALLYITFRTVIGPICALHLTYDLLFTKKGRKNVPIQLSIVWLLMCWGVLLGSIPWIKVSLNILLGAGTGTHLA